MIHDLVPSQDKILKQVMPKFDFVDPPVDPIELAHDLAQTLINSGGLGLAAPQIGMHYNAFALTGEKILVCFNPKIVDVSQEQLYLEEGCLSFPDLIVKVKRPKKIKLRYTEPNGNIVTKVFDGLTARCVQHEVDHLNGILYTDRANRIHLEQARKAQKKAVRAAKKS